MKLSHLITLAVLLLATQAQTCAYPTVADDTIEPDFGPEDGLPFTMLDEALDFLDPIVTLADDYPDASQADYDRAVTCSCEWVRYAVDNQPDDLADVAAAEDLLCGGSSKCDASQVCTAQSPAASVDSISFTPCGSGATAGYKVNGGSDCILQASINACYNYMGELDAAVATQSTPYGDLTTYCETDTVQKTLGGTADVTAIQLTIDYAEWSPFAWKNFNAGSVNIDDCSFERTLYSSSNCAFGSTETACNEVTDPSAWGSKVTTVNTGIADDSSLSGWTVHLDESEHKGRLFLPISDIVADNSNYCREMTAGLGGEVSSNSNSYYYQCYFAEQVTIWGEAQLVYSFHVQLQVDRTTSATESLSVTKTLVEGQCCSNSLGVESKMWFCDSDQNGADGGACTEANTLTEVARNTEFYIRWELDETDTDTAILKSLVSLYPDTVTVGPFIPDFSVNDSWEGVTTGGVSLIKLQSNVAFAASITVTGRVYNINDNQPGPAASGDTRPHTCFPVSGVYPTDTTAANCDQSVSNRRVLQTQQQQDDMGTANSQVQVSSAINIKQEDDNQNQNKSNKKDDDDNTALIAILVTLGVLVVIGGLVAGIYFCKKNQKANQYQSSNNNEVKA